MGTGAEVARRIRRPSDVTLVSEFLGTLNTHPNAVNGLRNWGGETKKLLADAKAKSADTMFYVMLALLSLRNGGIRYKNHQRAWLNLVPANMLSDFGADAFCFRELLNISGVADSEDVKRQFSGRTLEPVLFEALRAWNFNMPAVVQSLYELSQLVQEGFVFKLPARESFDQAKFTSCFAGALYRMGSLYEMGHSRKFLRQCFDSREVMEVSDSIISEILEPREIVLVDELSSSCMIAMRQDAGSALEEGQDFLAVLKNALVSDPDYYRVKLEELPDEASLYRSWLSPHKAAAQPQAVSVAVPAASAPAPKQIELIDLPEVPEALKAFPQLLASLDNLAAINEQLRKLQGAEEAARSAKDLESKIQALDLRLRQLHEEEVKLYEERELLATRLHQERQESVAGLDDPKALQAKGQEIKANIESFLQLAQKLSMA